MFQYRWGVILKKYWLEISLYFCSVQAHDFEAADYIVFVLTITVSLGIGIYYALSGGRQKTTSEYLVGNRKIAVLRVAISILVSFESSIIMLGAPIQDSVDLVQCPIFLCEPLSDQGHASFEVNKCKRSK